MGCRPPGRADVKASQLRLDAMMRGAAGRPGHGSAARIRFQRGGRGRGDRDVARRV